MPLLRSPALVRAALALAVVVPGFLAQAGAADANQPSTQTPAPSATTFRAEDRWKHSEVWPLFSC